CRITDGDSPSPCQGRLYRFVSLVDPGQRRLIKDHLSEEAFIFNVLLRVFKPVLQWSQILLHKAVDVGVFVTLKEGGKRVLGDTQVPLVFYFSGRGFLDFSRLFLCISDRELKKYLISRCVCGAKDGLVIGKLAETLLVGDGGRNGEFASLGEQNGKVF